MKKPTVPIKVNNVYSYAHITNKQLAEIILKDMSFFVDNFQFMKKYKEKKWDGRINFAKYSFPVMKIYTGLLVRLLNLLTKNGFDYEILDERKTPKEKINISLVDDTSALRDYQEAEMDNIIKEQRGIIQAPTGSGKTEMFIHLINRLQLPTLILTHTQDLLFQTADRCIKALNIPDIGILGAGTFEPSSYVTVALFQSLTSLFNEDKKSFKMLMDYYPVIIVDEAHHVNYNAKTFSKIVESSDAFYRYAFTATPKRNKADSATDIQLIALFGPQITEISKATLVEQGWLSPFEVFTIHYPVTKYYMTKQEYIMEYATFDDNGNLIGPQYAYREAFKDCIINNEDRLSAIAWVVNKHKDDQILISCHSEVLSEKIARRLNVKEITGNTQRFSKKEREQTYKDFRSGKIRVLVSTNIYSEGVDFPKLKVIILAEPFKSGILLLQKIGRTMRKSEGKEKGIVYDFADTALPFFNEQYHHRLLKYKEEQVTPVNIRLKESDLVG